jgi:hypothetical protein
MHLLRQLSNPPHEIESLPERKDLPFTLRQVVSGANSRGPAADELVGEPADGGAGEWATM